MQKGFKKGFRGYPGQHAKGFSAELVRWSAFQASVLRVLGLRVELWALGFLTASAGERKSEAKGFN